MCRSINKDISFAQSHFDIDFKGNRCFEVNNGEDHQLKVKHTSANVFFVSELLVPCPFSGPYLLAGGFNFLIGPLDLFVDSMFLIPLWIYDPMPAGELIPGLVLFILLPVVLIPLLSLNCSSLVGVVCLIPLLT